MKRLNSRIELIEAVLIQEEEVSEEEIEELDRLANEMRKDGSMEKLKAELDLSEFLTIQGLQKRLRICQKPTGSDCLNL